MSDYTLATTAGEARNDRKPRPILILIDKCFRSANRTKKAFAIAQQLAVSAHPCISPLGMLILPEATIEQHHFSSVHRSELTNCEFYFMVFLTISVLPLVTPLHTLS